MKNTVMIFVGTLLGMLSLAVIMTVMGYTNRAVELQNHLSSSAEKTLERAMAEHSVIRGQQELLAEQMQVLSEILDTDSSITVWVMKADAEKGILSVRVQESFGQPNGSVGETAWDRTVIWDREQTD